jgi:rSAM/selenodomain-associated transferase 2
MRAPISVVIPTLNAAHDLPECTLALFEGLEAGLIRELIISDGGSADDIAALAAELGATLVVGPAGRGGQLARGAGAASGDWLLFLHADTVLTDGWTRAVLTHLLTQPEKAGYFRLAFRANGLAPAVVAGWANFRARAFGLPYGDQGLLIPRGLYRASGGFRDISLMEDVAIARQLRGYLCALPAVAQTSAARYQQQGWLRRGARNLWALALYFAGVSPERLAREYQRK